MGTTKENEIEWYRKKVVPYYQNIVDIKLAKEMLTARERAIKEGVDVPKQLQD